MPRPERPLDSRDGIIPQFATQLRRLRHDVGGPAYRRLAATAHYSATTLSDAAGGRRMPSLAVTLAYVRACGGSTAEWEARWRAATARLSEVDDVSTAPSQWPGADDGGTVKLIARWTMEVNAFPAAAEAPLATVTGAQTAHIPSDQISALVNNLGAIMGGRWQSAQVRRR
jgi:hypothetical protein